MNKEKLLKWIGTEIMINPEIGRKQAEGMIRVREHILSEPEDNCYSQHNCEMKQDDKCTMFGPCPHQDKEKTNFDMITESPEKLAEFIIDVQNDVKKRARMAYSGILPILS